MDNIFYSEDEKIVFWVVGYCEMDNTRNVNRQIEVLKEKKDEFLSIFKKLPKNAEKFVKTLFVEDSRRYKYMRVFYLEDVLPKQVPEKAFHITNANDWTMWKWLTD